MTPMVMRIIQNSAGDGEQDQDRCRFAQIATLHAHLGLAGGGGQVIGGPS
jgi:hypothetical protein